VGIRGDGVPFSLGDRRDVNTHLAISDEPLVWHAVVVEVVLAVVGRTAVG